MIKLPRVYNWEKLVERNESPLIIDYLIRGVTTKNTKKVLGYPKGFEKYAYLNRDVYWDKDEVQGNIELADRITAKEGIVPFRQMLKKFVKTGESLFSVSRRLGLEDNGSKTKEKLISDFEEFSQANWRLSPAMLLPIQLGRNFAAGVEKILATRGLPVEKCKKYFMVLTFPGKESNSTIEMVSFYLLCDSVKRKMENNKWIRENIEKAVSGKDIKGYLDKFSWIEARWYIGEGWKREDVIERITSLNPNQDFGKMVRELKGLVKENKKEFKRISKELKLTKKEVDFVKTAKEFVYIRTYRTDIFNQAGFVARPFLREIAKRLGISFGELIFMSASEVNACLASANIPEQIYLKLKERQKSYGATLHNGEVIFFEGDELNQFRRDQNIVDSTDISVKEIKGVVACGGKVTGKARIVSMNKRGLSEVRIGDILVASMTTPDFIPAMQKAAAFVTDEGGITCHAAIVAREMKKPCIIGTKIATKVFKDGDSMEVDANTGIVKKI
ncbi:MAG: PEP-utilizing enzyme [Candidatus Staskawiczbacteria bacterium]|jgi:phosphohistidine swiveling domain-containing protein